MSDKRGIIKNIKPVFCRFDMDDEPERRAWQIIQKLSKGNPAFLCRYHTPIRQPSPSRRGGSRNRQPPKPKN